MAALAPYIFSPKILVDLEELPPDNGAQKQFLRKRRAAYFQHRVDGNKSRLLHNLLC
jgi:hypothetical protein